MFINAFIVICIILIFYIIVINYLENNSYNKLNGEENDNCSKTYIKIMKAKQNRKAIDDFRLGSVYLFNNKDLSNAAKYFNSALDKINKGDTKDAIFIFDKITDYENNFLNHPEITELNLRNTMLNYYKNKKIKIQKYKNYRNKITGNKLQKLNANSSNLNSSNFSNLLSNSSNLFSNISNSSNFSNSSNLPNSNSSNLPTLDPKITQKIILSNQKWHSDSQNVHDSCLHNEFKTQLLNVVENNQLYGKQEKIQPYDSEEKITNDLIDNLDVKKIVNPTNVYDDIVTYYKNKYKNDHIKMDKLAKVLMHLETNNPIHINNMREKDVVIAVWQRAHDPRNASVTEDIKSSLGECILDCVDNSVVCLAGRTSRYWQALSNLDFMPEIGTLQTKQAVRNEIFEKCASIVNTELSSELLEYYNSGKNNNPKLNAELDQKINNIKSLMDSLIIVYKDKLPDDDLSLIIEECKSVL